MTLNDVSGKELHDVVAGALDEVLVDLDDLHSLVPFDFGDILRFVILVQLPILDDGLTFGALDVLVFRLLLDCIRSETCQVHLMEAFAGLEHRNETSLQIGVRDLLVAVFARLFFGFPLHLLIIGLGTLSLGRVHEIFELHLTVDILLFLIWRLESLSLT